ncbi:MAG: J domain-containing protein [Fimbriimonadaceae bacterium]|nr:J domain-containing protein [Chthonomonadaceae bacterium]MCO5295813.1 J domain-containing protein [Fimbriimonadaceae bacterium]
MAKRSHYDVLGVSRNFSSTELRSAYRRQVLQYHPDRSKAPDAVERFIAVTAAYEVLSDPARRASYDRLIAVEGGQAAVRVGPQQRERQPAGQRARGGAKVREKPDFDHLTRLFATGRYADAERLARGLIKAHPKNPVPYAVLGDVLRGRNDLEGAARMYAYAYQMEPRNAVYARRHEELMDKLARRGSPVGFGHHPVGSLLIALVITVLLATYLAVSKEPALLPMFSWVSTWTLGLVMSLFIAGLVCGAALSHAELLDRFQAAISASAGRPSPTVALAFVAAVNFWAAGAMYVAIGQSQNAYQYSTSRLVGGTAMATVLLALAAAMGEHVDPLQTLLWGGNLVYLGAVSGWMVADSLRG